MRFGRNIRHATRASIAFAIGSTMLLVTAARADIEVSYGGPEQYVYRVTHVPDLDQKRSTLPNGGTLHCVPTSSINWAAYFANHGLPALPPGPGYWGYQFLYDEATAAILALGSAMLTGPPGGTDTNFAHLGLTAWLSLAGDNFIVLSFISDDDWSPTVHDANSLAMGGSYVILGVGWYGEATPQLIVRDGGHAVCIASGARSDDMWEIGIRDPASDEGDNTIQSPFTTEEYGIEHRFVKRAGFDGWRWMSRIHGYGGGGRQGYMDKFHAIVPMFALTTSPTEPGVIQIDRVMRVFGSPVPAFDEFHTPQMTAVQSLTVHPDGLCFLFIADSAVPGQPGEVWRLDPLTAHSQRVDLPFDDPREVMVGRRRDLFVMDGDELARVDLDHWPPVEEMRITPPSALSAMVYDDETDELVLLAPMSQEVLRYPRHFDAYPDTRPITPEIPLAADASICWDASRGVAWVASEASNSLFKLTPAAGVPLMISQEFTHSVLTGPINAIDCNDSGHLFVSCQGMLREFEIVDDALVLADNPLFPEAEAGAQLCIAKSRTNYDENMHGGPEWYDVLPDAFNEPIEDCVADLDGNGTVNTGDLLALLAAWGPCPPDEFCHADFDYNNEVGVSDLLTLLASWGPCRPIAACCLWDGTCLDLTAAECYLHENSTWHENESCGAFDCPALPTGACCVDGECIATNTDYECSLLGGLWYVDVSCALFDCPTTHCDASGSCGQYISRVRFGAVDKQSGCTSGYSDYTDLVAEIAVGHGLAVLLNTTNAQAGDVCGIWVDWDQDLVFDDPRDFVASGDLSGSAWYTSVGAPLDARAGPTRMRFCLVNNDFPLACGPLGPGEVEDYTLIVIDQTYCRADSECDQYISRVQFGTIDHSSDCALGWYGYSDFTNLATEVQIGVATPITITIDYGESGDQCAAWIDWNRDLDFDDEDEAIVLSGTPGPGPYTANVVPPPGAAIGETRLRIRSVRDHEPMPCAEQSIGETEDYTIIVVE